MSRCEGLHDITPSRIIQVAELVNYVNPTHPGDSFSPSTLAALLSSSRIDMDEFKIIHSLLPEHNGDTRTEIILRNDGKCSIKFNRTMKKSGVFYSIHFASDDGLCFPITTNLTVYGDMDDDKNHHEDCDGNNCQCEAPIVFAKAITFQNSKILKHLPKWLNKNLLGSM